MSVKQEITKCCSKCNSKNIALSRYYNTADYEIEIDPELLKIETTNAPGVNNKRAVGFRLLFKNFCKDHFHLCSSCEKKIYTNAVKDKKSSIALKSGIALTIALLLYLWNKIGINTQLGTTDLKNIFILIAVITNGLSTYSNIKSLSTKARLTDILISDEVMIGIFKNGIINKKIIYSPLINSDELRFEDKYLEEVEGYPDKSYMYMELKSKNSNYYKEYTNKIQQMLNRLSYEQTCKIIDQSIQYEKEMNNFALKKIK